MELAVEIETLRRRISLLPQRHPLRMEAQTKLLRLERQLAIVTEREHLAERQRRLKEMIPVPRMKSEELVFAKSAFIKHVNLDTGESWVQQVA